MATLTALGLQDRPNKKKPLKHGRPCVCPKYTASFLLPVLTERNALMYQERSGSVPARGDAFVGWAAHRPDPCRKPWPRIGPEQTTRRQKQTSTTDTDNDSNANNNDHQHHHHQHHQRYQSHNQHQHQHQHHHHNTTTTPNHSK